MKARYFLLLILAIFTSAIGVAAPAKKKVAIYVMDQNSTYTKRLGNYIVVEFVNSDKFTAIDRSSAFLAELRKEQSYQESGNVSDEEITRIGKQMGVDYIVTVESFYILYSTDRINVRMIDVEKARVLGASYKEISEASDAVRDAKYIYNELTSGFMEYDRSIFPNISVYVTGNQSNATKKHLNCAFIEAFSKEKYLNVLERNKTLLEGISKELGYQQSGAVSDSEISEIGKQSGAHLICVVECDNSFISSRVVNTETGEIVDAANKEVQNIYSIDDVQSVARNLFENSNSLDMLLNLIVSISNTPEVFEVDKTASCASHLVNYGEFLKFLSRTDRINSYTTMMCDNYLHLCLERCDAKLLEKYDFDFILSPTGEVLRTTQVDKNKGLGNRCRLSISNGGLIEFYINKYGRIKNISLPKPVASKYVLEWLRLKSIQVSSYFEEHPQETIGDNFIRLCLLTQAIIRQNSTTGVCTFY